MEDPKRLRTKLRLDLNDVSRQIEDLEDLLEDDKSTENVEAHSKLIEYEKKLKQQYEEMTGITLDDAVSLKSNAPTLRTGTGQRLSKFMGLVGGILFTWAFYNMILQSITGFAPTDFMEYYTGGGQNAIAGGLRTLAVQLSNDDNQLYIILPLIASTALIFLSSLLTKGDSKFLAFFEFLGFLAITSFFIWAITLTDDVSRVVARFSDNLIIFSLTFILAGAFSLVGAFGKDKLLARLPTLVTGIVFIWGGAQIILISLDTGDTANQLLFNWPWVMLAGLISGITYTVSNIFK